MVKKYVLKSMPAANCHVEIERTGETGGRFGGKLVRISLVSYKSEVLRIYPDENSVYWCDIVDCNVNYSPTTARHVNRFTTEFFGKNLYHELKNYDWGSGALDVDKYSHWITCTGMEYETNGKRYNK